MPERIMQEAYSHEVASAGFWPGSDGFAFPSFYAYCYPGPAAYGEQPVEPKQAYYDTNIGEYLLKYEDVQQSADPADTLLKFLNTTFKAAEITGNWKPDLNCNLTEFEK